MRSSYIVFALSAFTLGFSVSLWRASGETDLQRQATRLTELALAAQAQSTALSEELLSERKARKLAEDAEHSAQEQLALESKARETAEEAHEKAAERAAGAAKGLAEQTSTTAKLEARLADLEKQFELAKVKIAAQIAARKDVQVDLFNAKAQLRTLSAQLHEEISGKEAAETARAKAEADAKAAAEKLALELKGREAASNTKKAPLSHRVTFRRQKQAAAPRFLTRTRN
jgi:colicin import membrane protein